jgi:hypothetical protein
MISPSPSVTVMIRPAADETTTRDGRPLAQAGTSYVANGPASYMRGEELAVAAPARPSGRDGVMLMASPPPPRRRWLLEGAGAAFQHVLTASTVTYDQSERTVPYAHESGLIARLLGVVIEAVNAYGVRLLRI